MNKRFLLLLLFLFQIGINLAQQATVDSLVRVFDRSQSKVKKIEALHQLYQVTQDLSYARQNLNYSTKVKDEHGIALSLKDIGRHYFFSEKKDSSLNYLNRAVKIAEKTNDNKVLVHAYRYIGYIYIINDPITAKSYYEKSLKIAIELKDEIAKSYIYSALGTVYEGMLAMPNNNEEALVYFLKSLEIRERLGSPEEISSSLNETSRVYTRLGYHDKASHMKERGLAIAEEINSLENISYLCLSIGFDYLGRKNNPKKALEYFLKGLPAAQAQKDNFSKMFTITKVIAQTYSKLGDLKLADKYYQLAMSFNDSIQQRANLYDYNLSVMKHKLEQQLANQKMLLKDAQIDWHKAESEKQTAVRNSFVIGCIFLIFLLVAIYLSYREKKKSNQELAQKNEKIKAVHALLEIQKESVDKNNVLLQRLLREKEMLFKEVHHRVKNNLQIISSLLNLQSNTLMNDSTREVLKQSQSRINAMAILHTKLYQTDDVSHIPIEEYLNLLVSSISDSFCTEDCTIQFTVEADPSIQLNIDSAIPFGLIVNELITNSMKYAFKEGFDGLISISLKQNEQLQYELHYADNGCGMPDDFRLQQHKSLGLELIEMLTEQLYGTVEIYSDKGAHFDITFLGVQKKNN